MKPKHILRRFRVWILLLVCFLVVGRLLLPYFVTRYVNHALQRIPGYSGSISGVDISLFRGAYSVESLTVKRVNGKVKVPFLSTPNIDFSVQWNALFEGKWVGEVYVERPQMNFVRSDSEQKSQLEVDSEWLEVVKDLFPLRLNRFEINDGQVHYRDFESKPPIDVQLQNVEVIGANFSNTRSPTTTSIARIDASAKTPGSGQFRVSSDIQPGAKVPTFSVNASLEQFNVTEANPLFRAYGAFDAESGKADIYTEIVAEDNFVRGYVKPLVKDLSILRFKNDYQNPLRLLWESILGLFAEIFENQRHEQIAAKVEFSGPANNAETGLFQTIGSLVGNAFVKALKKGPDENVHLSDGSEQSISKK